MPEKPQDRVSRANELAGSLWPTWLPRCLGGLPAASGGMLAGLVDMDVGEGRAERGGGQAATSSHGCGAVSPGSNRPAILGLHSAKLRQQPAKCLQAIAQSPRYERLAIGLLP